MRLLLLVLVCLLLVHGCAPGPRPAKPEAPGEGPGWKAGAARVAITPGEPLWMAGYASREKPAEGKFHDLYVKALTIEDPRGEQAVLVTSDILGFPRELADAIAAGAKERFGLGREHLMLTSTHTHSGPVIANSLRPMYINMPAAQYARIEAYTRELEGKVLQAIGESLQNREPARLLYHSGTAGFAFNRRKKNDEGIFINAQNPEGSVDRDVPVLRVENAAGDPVVVVFSYACHNTTYKDYNWSGDYAGFAQKFLEERHPGTTAMFFMGCGADVNPYPRHDSKGEHARAHGKSLADAVDAVLEKPMHPLVGGLRAAYDVIDLSFAKLPTKEELESQLAREGTPEANRAKFLLQRIEKEGPLPETYPYPVQAWQFGGELTLVALGGEVVVDYAVSLRTELCRELAWIAAYANDVMGYVPSKRVLDEGGYEPDYSAVYYGLPSRWADDVEEKIVTKVRDMTRRLRRGGDRDVGLSPSEALRTFYLQDGCEIEIAACEPNTLDPVFIAFDPKGRMWVAEMGGLPYPTRPDGSPGGRVRVLEDRDGDGFFEWSRVFLDNIYTPSGLAFWRDGILVIDSPDLFFARDIDGDFRADEKKILFTGFGAGDPEHRPSFIQYGPDNWYHACGGGAGGRGIVTCPQRPGMEISFRNTHWRFLPDTLQFDLMSGYDTGYGLDFDGAGRRFVVHNMKHAEEVLIENRYLARVPTLGRVRTYRDISDHGQPGSRLYPLTPPQVWRVVRTSARRTDPRFSSWPKTEMQFNGFVTSACSPILVDGILYSLDPANNVIHRDRIEYDGAGYVARRIDKECEFIASTDPWFRPGHITLGPDGALYIVDTCRELIETPLSLTPDLMSYLGPYTGEDKGRIYRVVPKDWKRPTRRPALDESSTAELAATLADGNRWWRRTARRLLVERNDPDAIPPARKVLHEAEAADARREALWTLDGLGGLKAEDVTRALEDPDPKTREYGLKLSERFAGDHPALADRVLKLAEDSDPHVRYQAAFTLGYVKGERAAAALEKIAVRDFGDEWFRAAILTSSSPHALRLMDAVLSRPELGGGALEFLRRLASIAGYGGTEEDRGKALEIIGKHAEKTPVLALGALEGLGEGLHQKRVERLSARIAKAPEVVRKSLRAVFRLAGERAADAKRNVHERVGAVALLAHAPYEDVADVLKGLLAKGQHREVQLASVRALAGMGSDEIAGMLLAAWDDVDPLVRREITESVFRSKSRLVALVDALERRVVQPADLEPARKDQLRMHPDDSIRTRATSIFGAGGAEDRGKLVVEKMKLLDLDVDAQRGIKVFDKLCSTCHVYEGQGTEVGPDLATVRDRAKGSLLADILDPNARVVPMYVDYILQTEDEEIITGMLVNDSETSVTLRRAEGVEETVPKSEIMMIKASGRSLMPDGMEKDLSDQDIADVIEYIKLSGR